MRIVETPVYDFTELSDTARDKARTWFRETIDHDWWDSVYDDFEQICPILGVTLATRTVRLMGGGTRQKPCIWFSGFWSQGDGACFEGRYAYAPRAPLRIRDYAPQDTELHRIADALQALQRPNFYQLDGLLPADRPVLARLCDDVRRRPRQPCRPGDRRSHRGRPGQALRDLANWLYRTLEREYEFQTSDETVDEGMSANGYTFTAEGRRFG